MLNVKEDIDLILNCIERFFVIDADGKILYMADNLAEHMGYADASCCIGKKVREIWKDDENTLHKILQTGEQKLGEISKQGAQTIICNRVPVYQDGQLIAAFEYAAFSEQQLIESFLEKILEVSNELDFMEAKYKNNQISKYTIVDISGKSRLIEELKEQIKKVAPSDASVLIQGETGTGKELVVHAIHNLSNRKNGKFVKINCSAIPEHIFEAELFGYEEGSFTGAKKGGRIGKIESADGGTIFLDEISRAPISIQPKLLRFLQEKEISRIGSGETISVDVRVISATNQDIYGLVQKGEFREDLYYRLNVMEINVPPLRYRKEDISILAHVLLERINDELERRSHRVEHISDAAIALLEDHDWPGNVRELHNMIESAVNICYEKVLTEQYFVELQHKKEADSHLGQPAWDLEFIKNEAEENAIKKMLGYCKGNKSQAAELLNISRQSLYNKMKKYNISG